MIIKAFTTYKSLNLVLVGNWNVSSYAQELRKKYETVANIYLLDPIYNQIDLDLIRSNCYVYVHGHSAGGTNPSLVEAMYLRLPILSFGVNYNRETTGNKALYFEDENSLVQLLIDLSQERLLEVAIAMQAIAEERHTWKIVAESYANIFSPALVPLKVGA